MKKRSRTHRLTPRQSLTTLMALVVTSTFCPRPAAGQNPPPPPPDEEALFEVLEDLDPGLREQLAKVLGENAPLMIDDALGEAADLEGMFDASAIRRFGELNAGVVKTNSDSETLLERAEAFAKQGRFDLASRLWQEAIGQSGDALIQRDEWIQRTFHGSLYRTLKPMIGEIEASMARTIEGSLEAYQLKIDGDARALLARSTRDTREAALAEIVLRYFFSSIGDDAAFELGCLQMERGEFLPAVRLFTKILDDFPNPSMDRAEVEIRLAGALARTGDADQALQIVDSLHAELPEKRRVLEAVRQDIEQVQQQRQNGGDQLAVLTTPLSVQPSLLEVATLPETLEVAWSQSFDLRLPADWVVLPEATRPSLPDVSDPFQQNRPRNQTQTPPPRRPDPVARWRQVLKPVGQMLIRGDRIFFKSDDRVVACNATTGELEWLGTRHRLVLDENTRLSSRRRYGSSNVTAQAFPQTAEEYLLFGDRVHQSMTLTEDTLYVLEGEPLDFRETPPETRPVNPPRRFGVRASTPGRFRDNRLVAYEADTGKLKWYRPATEAAAPNLPTLARAGFSRAPLPYGSLLVLPVHEENALWLTGLDQSTGETRWRTFLCDEPAGECQGLLPVAVTVNSGDAYVGSGAGLLFSVNAVTGTLNWALEYPRLVDLPAPSGVSTLTPFYHNVNRYLDGWTEDQLITHGNEILLAGSDFSQLFAVQRRTGKLAWETPQTPFRSPHASSYVLAAHEGRVYVGGERTVRCYQSRGGKMLWETMLPQQSLARGAFTPDALYIPLLDRVAQIDPETGRLEAVAQVRHPSPTQEPVGNLFTDGQRLLVFGLKRIYALTVKTPAATTP